jgi:hypothetical protein
MQRVRSLCFDPGFDRSAKFFEGVDFVKLETRLRPGRSELCMAKSHKEGSDNDIL